VTSEELDARFARFGEDVREAILSSGAESRRHAEELAARARQYADELVERSREHAERSRRETATQIADNRHFFQVIAEDLVAKIQLVAEGVTTVDQKLDRFRDEVRGEFVVVGRRLDRLESRVARLETPA
jgi:hypothetical protein